MHSNSSMLQIFYLRLCTAGVFNSLMTCLFDVSSFDFGLAHRWNNVTFLSQPSKMVVFPKWQWILRKLEHCWNSVFTMRSFLTDQETYQDLQCKLSSLQILGNPRKCALLITVLDGFCLQGSWVQDWIKITVELSSEMDIKLVCTI